MPYAMLWGLANGLLVLPILVVVWRLCRRFWPGRGGLEALLVTAILTPCVMLGEMILIGFLPVERPLRLLLPWAHLVVVAGASVVLFVGRANTLPLLRSAMIRAARLWRCAGPPLRVAMLATLLAVMVAFLHAAWNTGDEHDGAMYRLTMVLQPWQDGRIGPVTCAWYGYANAYPRTVELLYSWTVLCTGNTVGIHLVNWYFLLLLALAACVACRRLGLSRRRSIWAGLLAATTPLPIYLTSVLYNDLPVAALLAAAVALSLTHTGLRVADVIGACLALALAASAKFNAVPVAVVIGAWLAIRSFRGRPGPLAVCSALAIAAAIASLQYIRSWILYDSPVWPVRFGLAGRTLFDGPVPTEWMFITAKGPWPIRWATSLFKLFQTTSQDANGSFGLLFAIGVLPTVFVTAFRAVVQPRRAAANSWLLILVFLVPFAVPQGTNLRYSLIMLPAGYALLMGATSRWPIPRVVGPALAILLCVNVVDWGRAVVKEVTAQLRAGASLLAARRNFDWYLRFMYIQPGLDPRMHPIVHRVVRPGERLVYSVNCLPGLLYDQDIRYAIEFRSIASLHDLKAPPVTPSATPEQSRQWLDSLRRDAIPAVLVHAGTFEDVALRAPGSGFGRVYVEEPGGAWPAAVMYRRAP